MKLFLASLLAVAAVKAVPQLELCLDDTDFDADAERYVEVECTGCHDSYFFLDNVPFLPAQEANAWCVDIDRNMNAGRYYFFDTYSSYADDIPSDAIDKPENLPKLNYLLNHYRTTDVCGSFQITYKEVQQAIWNLIDDGVTHSSLNGKNVACADALTADAELNGADFQPCDLGPDAVLGVLIIVDNDDGNIQKQVLVAETPAVCKDCTPREMCLEDSAYEDDAEHQMTVDCYDCNDAFLYLDSIPFSPGEAAAWCVDLDRVIEFDTAYSFDTYSSYANNIPQSAVDQPEKLPEVNYLLNHYRTTTLCGPGLPGMREVQQTVWNLIDDELTSDSVAGYDAACVDALTQDAIDNGLDFNPCDMDGDAILGLILVVDNSNGGIQKQVLVAEVPAICEDCGPDVGVVVGDPHIYTFDGLTNDCQAAGEFVLLKSTTTTRQVQARFAHITNAGFWSVTKSVVVQDQGNSPIVQVNVPELAGSYAPDQINGCAVQFFVDGVQREMSTGSGTSDVVVVNTGTEVEIFYASTGFRVTLSSAHGAGECFLNQVVRVPKGDLSIIGLLGTPNGDPLDDWMDSSGTPVTLPDVGSRTGEAGYNYCTTNWCIRQASESLYTFNEPGISFNTFMQCDLAYGGTVNDIIANAPQDVLDLCGGDEPCIIDGVVGGLEAARAALEARLALQETKNGVGGECRIAQCQEGLHCVDSEGSKICVEAVPCPNCVAPSSGSCHDLNNDVCFPIVNGACPPNTAMCHSANIFVDETESESPPQECSGCWAGTSGPCQAANTVCYPLIGGACPNGSFACEGGSARRLRGASN